MTYLTFTKSDWEAEIDRLQAESKPTSIYNAQTQQKVVREIKSFGIGLSGGGGFAPSTSATTFKKYVVLEEFIAGHLDLITKRRFKRNMVFYAKMVNGRLITKRGFVIPDNNKIKQI
jgi:hypothetical protein